MASVVASAWKFQPYRANGVPTPLSFVTPLTFTTSGMPEPPPQTGQPGANTSTGAAPPNAPTTGPPIMTSSTVNGRLPGLQSTDEAGLTAATSKCTIATDATYGLTIGSPVKVGGDFNNGPARERQYLMALRGPAGQGLSIVRRGTVMAPDQTILDLWEVSYTGLAKPIQIYLDEYHEEPLKAPQGLVCAVPVAR
jgi:hypothetical protein